MESIFILGKELNNLEEVMNLIDSTKARGAVGDLASIAYALVVELSRKETAKA